MGRGNLAEETAAAIGLPAPEQQQETIRQLQHRASWQPPIKDDGTHIDEQDIVDVLVMGSGFCEGRFRIQEFFSATVLPTVKEQADWLKKEYGIGGRTWDFRDGERGFLDYDAKGLRIKRYASDNAPDHFRLLPWNEVARRLHLLVHNDKYLDENNKQGYEKWEAEQKAKRDARQAEIDYAEKTIADFCEREGLGAPDYSDLTHIDLAYSTTGDGEHEIQVYANFLRNEIVYLVDGSFVDSARFDSTRALAKEGIEDVEFSQFIDDTKMKKAAGAVLAVAMGMTCIPTPLAVYAQEPEEYTVILDENFESELSAGVKLSGGVSVVEMDGNHVLEFNDTSDSETSKANIEIGKQAGEIVVEYKLYVVSDEGKSTIALTAGSKEESGSSSTSSAGEFLRFKTTGSDSRTYEFRGGDSQKTPSVKNGAYLCGKWIELKSVIDTATKTFDVYADGELLGENIAMSCKTENIVMESLDNISFLTGSMDKTHAYIDDVRVSLKTTDSGEGDGDGEDEKTPGELGCIDFVAGGWKLQLPVESDTKPGSVLEKSPQELADGYTSEFFFAATDENGQDAVVFHCPVQGFKTGNTTYARSEMREMLDPKDKTVNWTWQGTHTLVAEQKVTHVPANGKVITSQIHGIEQNGDNANPLVKVLYAYDKAKGTGSVIVYLKNTTEKTSADFAYAYPEVALGEKYRTEIQVVDGTAYVTIDTDDNEPMTVSHNFVAADPLWKDTWYYFKLGNYIQDSVDSSEEAYSDVWVYSSGISHSETVEKTPVESIRIDSSEIQLQPGERTSLSVTVKPIKAYNKAVTWDVLEGADVVAVDAKGYVTALKEGTAVVRATSVDNSIATSTCHVTVQQGEAVQAEKLYSCDFGRESGLDLHTAFNTEFMQVIPESAEGTSVTLEQESEGNVIRFRDNSNNATSKISFVFQPQTDTTTISFRVRIDALGEHKAGDLTFGCMYAVAAGSDSWYSNTTELFRVRNAAKGALGNFSDLTYVLTNAYTPISLNADKVVGNYGDWVDVTYIITPEQRHRQGQYHRCVHERLSGRLRHCQPQRH